MDADQAGRRSGHAGEHTVVGTERQGTAAGRGAAAGPPGRPAATTTGRERGPRPHRHGLPSRQRQESRLLHTEPGPGAGDQLDHGAHWRFRLC